MSASGTNSGEEAPGTVTGLVFDLDDLASDSVDCSKRTGSTGLLCSRLRVS